MLVYRSVDRHIRVSCLYAHYYLTEATEIPAHSAIIDYDSKVRKFLADLPEALRHRQGGNPQPQDGPNAMLGAIFCQYIITIHVNEVLL